MKKQQTYWDWTAKNSFIVGSHYHSGFKSLGDALEHHHGVAVSIFNWVIIKIQSNKIVAIYSIKEAERILKIEQL